MNQTPADEKDLGIAQLEHSPLETTVTNGEKLQLAEAQEQHEKELTLWQNLRLYKRVSDVPELANVTGGAMVRCHVGLAHHGRM
jgi:hypothetical protein